jgi:hypothetical protein
MDRGEYRAAVPDTDDGTSSVSSVVPFPSREER